MTQFFSCTFLALSAGGYIFSEGLQNSIPRGAHFALSSGL